MLPAFQELAETTSPLNFDFHVINDVNYEIAKQDSLTALPKSENFKRPEQADWKSYFEKGSLKERLSFIYFAHVNLKRTLEGVLRYLTDSKSNLGSYLAED